MNARSRAFTLVELLVILSVVILLIALLLPTLGNARNSAKRTVCLSNMRSISLASQVYLMDYRQYPQTDGSWLYRVKSNPDEFRGIGQMLRAGSFGETPTENLIAKALFCPDARPTWNYVTPKRVYLHIFITPSTNTEIYSTYVGKFCTFIGYNDNSPTATFAQATRANLYGAGRQSASRVSPLVASDFIFDSDDPWTDKQQAHRGEGVNAGFHDGSAQWIPFSAIKKDYTTFGGMYNNINPYGNFWRFARVTYGDGSTGTGP